MLDEMKFCLFIDPHTGLIAKLTICLAKLRQETKEVLNFKFGFIN